MIEHLRPYQRGPWKHNSVTVIRKHPKNDGEINMTAGLTSRTPRVRIPSRLPYKNGELPHETSSDSVGSDTSKNAAIQGSSHNPKHNSVTALVRQFEETVEVSKRELLAARAELMEQVDAIDAVLRGAGRAPTQWRKLGPVKRAIADEARTVAEVAQLTGVRRDMVATQLSRAVKIGKATASKPFGGGPTRYRLRGDS